MPIELTIGKLAKKANVNIETVRYYQRIGLIDQPEKPLSGFRTYPASDIDRVCFIKRAQELGFTLMEIKELLDLGDGQCREAQQMVKDKLGQIDSRLHDLTKMRSALTQLYEQCLSNEENAHCALIEALTKDTP